MGKGSFVVKIISISRSIFWGVPPSLKIFDYQGIFKL